MSTACHQIEVFSRVLRTYISSFLEGGEETMEKNLTEFTVCSVFWFLNKLWQVKWVYVCLCLCVFVWLLLFFPFIFDFYFCSVLFINEYLCRIAFEIVDCLSHWNYCRRWSAMVNTLISTLRSWWAFYVRSPRAVPTSGVFVRRSTSRLNNGHLCFTLFCNYLPLEVYARY